MSTNPLKSVPPGSKAAAKTGSAGLASIESVIFQDVSVVLLAKLGQLRLTVAELLGLESGQVLTLDTLISHDIELKLNSSVVARGQIVVVGDHFGIRITEIAEQET